MRAKANSDPRTLPAQVVFQPRAGGLDSNPYVFGSGQSASQKVHLRAGPLTLVYHAGSLRNICWKDFEIIRQIFITLRDENWREIPVEISGLQINRSEHSFFIQYRASCRRGMIQLDWDTRLAGDPSGKISGSMNGAAVATFPYNRIGFCVLIPTQATGGRVCQVGTIGGNTVSASLPEDITPGPLFTDIQSFAYQVDPHAWLKIELNGDLYEMEDQRNWSDASYKLYPTPLRLPRPKTMREGSRVEQSIQIEWKGPKRGGTPRKTDPIIPVLSVGEQVTGRLPAIGLGLDGESEDWTDLQIDRLTQLRLHHLRVDLKLALPDACQKLEFAWSRARAVRSALEIACFFSDQLDDELAVLEQAIQRVNPRISHFLVFSDHDRVTPIRLLKRVSPVLKKIYPAVPVGGGGRTSYADLNRDRSICSIADMVAYALNPQVHTSDSLSLMESLPAVGKMVRSARGWSGNLPLAVTPITLKPQINPLTFTPFPSAAEELPSSVDPRQASLFGACWTLGSLKYLIESQVSSLTCYETAGWRGVLETKTGSPNPEQFASFPECVYPLYHIFADIGEYAGVSVHPVHSSHPGRLLALGLQKGRQTRILAANLTEEPLEFFLKLNQPLQSFRCLDESSVVFAMKYPETWRLQKIPCENGTAQMKFLASPYAVFTIDCGLTAHPADTNMKTLYLNSGFHTQEEYEQSRG